MKIQSILKPAAVVLACLAALIALVGCASTPPAQGIKVGMTKQQVVAVAGNPQGRQTLGVISAADSAELQAAGVPKGIDEVWSYSNNALNLIPIYGLVNGMHSDQVAVYFKNGKVASQISKSGGLW